MASTSPNAQIDLSLDRIDALLQRLSRPQHKFPVIHVAGTNAKGSTIAYLDSILRNAVGLRTGTFTSPYLVEERDCCRVNGELIEEGIWQEAGQKVVEADREGSPEKVEGGSLGATPFEILTARSLLSFALLSPQLQPDLLLIEVGVGGRLDATNVFDPFQLLASVISPIDIDHQALLGNSLGEIANEKAGIVKPGGLCIMADQRRDLPQSQEEFDSSSIVAGPGGVAQYGKGAEEVVDAVREACTALQARLVKAYIPLQALASTSPQALTNSDPPPPPPWSIYTSSSVRFSPTLFLSKAKAGNYVARTGDGVVAGPSIVTPTTKSALTASHTALQTLWSIARDEPPSALERAGTDGNEELRLKIAWALRDDRVAQEAVQKAVGETRWAGRSEWMEIKVSKAMSRNIDDSTVSLEVNDADGMEVDGEEKPQHLLHLLVDGAHNTASARALRSYIDSCIGNRVQNLVTSPTLQQGKIILDLTWILGFSKGKAMEEMLSVLLSKPEGGVSRDDGLVEKFDQIEIDKRERQGNRDRSGLEIRQRVGSLRFSTPVQGMPWISSINEEEIDRAVEKVSSSSTSSDGPAVKERRAFTGDAALQEALAWARSFGDGSSIEKRADEGVVQVSLVILAGSLYLVGDLHRWILAKESP